MNDRVDEDPDLESNHDEVSSSDVFGKADKIAQEILDLILVEYKGDYSYIVSCEKKDVDEESFLTKFPYTLDKPKEQEQEFSPPRIMSETPDKPIQKVKTAKEIQDEEFMKKHEAEQA